MTAEVILSGLLVGGMVSYGFMSVLLEAVIGERK